MLALDASSGSTLWSYAAGSSVIAGATVSGDSVYWGSGYAHLRHSWLHGQQQVLRLLEKRKITQQQTTPVDPWLATRPRIYSLNNIERCEFGFGDCIA